MGMVELVVVECDGKRHHVGDSVGSALKKSGQPDAVALSSTHRTDNCLLQVQPDVAKECNSPSAAGYSDLPQPFLAQASATSSLETATSASTTSPEIHQGNDLPALLKSVPTTVTGSPAAQPLNPTSGWVRMRDSKSGRLFFVHIRSKLSTWQVSYVLFSFLFGGHED
jgi:hypothetical protein